MKSDGKRVSSLFAKYSAEDQELKGSKSDAQKLIVDGNNNPFRFLQDSVPEYKKIMDALNFGF